MIDDKKIEKIKKNCIESAKKEVAFLKNENDTICEEKVGSMIEEYQKELEEKFNKESYKIQREFNRKVFDFEIEERVRINNYKNNMEHDLVYDVITKMLEFVNSNEYEGYLFNNINKVLNFIQDRKESILYVTENDFNKFKDKLYGFNLEINTIPNENIGGCMVIDNKAKISYDNTIKNNITEKVKNMKLF